MNPDMVTKIKVSREPIQMRTNAGTKVMALEGQVDGFGRVYYDPTQMANIFGFAKLADNHRIVYDSEKEDAFHVYMDHGIVKFTRTDEGLYVYKPTPKFLQAVAATKGMKPLANYQAHETSLLVSTVSENKLGYTKRQFDDAKRARRLYHIVGCPTVENFKHILRQNIIKNCPVTIDERLKVKLQGAHPSA
jgi:hypothetical protein